MIQKKVCMMGAFATGKTSLVSRFVSGIFSEKYLSTVGVKIDRHVVDVDGQEMTLILWDLHGQDEFQRVRKSYLRGSSGCLLVVDGTRIATLHAAIKMHAENEDVIGDIPFIVAINKSDLKDQWELPPAELEDLAARGFFPTGWEDETGAIQCCFLTLSAPIFYRWSVMNGVPPSSW
jgi:small GTP-binding protein